MVYAAYFFLLPCLTVTAVFQSQREFTDYYNVGRFVVGLIIIVDDTTNLTSWFLSTDQTSQSYSGVTLSKNNDSLVVAYGTGISQLHNGLRSSGRNNLLPISVKAVQHSDMKLKQNTETA